MLTWQNRPQQPDVMHRNYQSYFLSTLAYIRDTDMNIALYKDDS
jgi:hypothetical protein